LSTTPTFTSLNDCLYTGNAVVCAESNLAFSDVSIFSVLIDNDLDILGLSILSILIINILILILS